MKKVPVVFLISFFVSILSSSAQKKTSKTLSVSPRSLININADNKLLKVFETGNTNMLYSIIAPSFINHSGNANKIGIDSLKAGVKAFHQHFKPVKMEIKRQWADEEYVSDWIRYLGSNPGAVIDGIELTRYLNGKAVEHWFFPNSQPKK